MREFRGSNPGPVKSAQCRQPLATDAMFLWSCVVQALSRGEKPGQLLHTSADYRKHNEDLILYTFAKGAIKGSNKTHWIKFTTNSFKKSLNILTAQMAKRYERLSREL